MTTDRYKSFAGIDCDGNSQRVIETLLRHLEDPARRNPFWDAFQVKLREAAEDPTKPDALRLVCSNVYYIEELFEACDDSDGLALLAQLEEECC